MTTADGETPPAPGAAPAARSEWRRRRTVCPACHEVISTGGVRCPHCFVELDHYRALPDDEVARRMEEYDRRMARTGRFRRPRRRTVVLAVVLLLLAYVGFRAWEIWLRPIPDLPRASTAVAVVAGPAGWPLANGDLGGTRSTSAPAHVDGAIAWTAQLGARALPGMTTDGSVVVAALDDGRMRALAAADGRTLWEESFSNPLWAPPSVAGGLVFAGERNGRVAAYDAGTGALRWAVQTQTTLATAILVSDGIAYVYGPDGIFAFDAATGRDVWKSELHTNWAYTTPALDGRSLTYATGNELRIFDRTTGLQTYWYRFKHAQPFGVVAAGGVAYGLSTDIGAAIDVGSRNPWWEEFRSGWERAAVWRMLPTPQPAAARWLARRPVGGSPRVQASGLAPALGPTALYAATAEGEVRALDRATGQTLWQQQVGAIAAAPTLTASGLLLVQPGRLLLLDPGSGTQTNERAFAGETLVGAVVTNGATYVATDSGALLALR